MRIHWLLASGFTPRGPAAGYIPGGNGDEAVRDYGERIAVCQSVRTEHPPAEVVFGGAMPLGQSLRCYAYKVPDMVTLAELA